MEIRKISGDDSTFQGIQTALRGYHSSKVKALRKPAASGSDCQLLKSEYLQEFEGEGMFSFISVTNGKPLHSKLRV